MTIITRIVEMQLRVKVTRKVAVLELEVIWR